MRYIVLFLVCIFFFAVAGTLWSSQSSAILARIQDNLAYELTNAVGSDVSFSKAEVASYNSIAIHNVIIRDKHGKPIAASDKVVVKYSPIAVLREQAAVTSIQQINLAAPQIYLTRQADGRWNVEELLERTKYSETLFSGQVVLNDAMVTVTMPEGQWKVEGINGRCEFSDRPQVGIRFAGNHQGSAIQAEGTVNVKGQGVLTLKAESLLVDDYLSLYPAASEVHPVSGRLEDIEITLQRKNGIITYAGEALLDKVAMNIRQISVRDIQGLVTFSEKEISLFRTSGRVNDMAQGSSGTVVLENAVAKLNYTNGFLHIQRLAADVFGGHITASGVMQPDQQSFYFSLNGREVDISAIPGLSPNISGSGDVSLIVDGQGTLDGASVQGAVSLWAGELAGVPYSRLNSGFYKEPGGRIILDYLTMQVGQGVVTASGSSAPGASGLKIDIRGQNVPLNFLPCHVNGLVLDGTTDFAGTITGGMDAPEFSADFTAVNGQVFYQPFSRAVGSMHVTPQRLTLNGVELTKGKTHHKIQGTIALTGQRNLNVTVASRQARAEDIVKLLAPGEKLTGNVDNDVLLTGPLANFDAEGRLSLTEGSFRGHLIAKGEGCYRRQNGVITIEDFIINSLNTEVKLSGTINASNQMDFDIMAQDIDLARIHYDSPYPIKGRVNFTGKLTGVSSNPLFSGEIRAENLNFNGQEISNVVGLLNGNSGYIEIPSFSFTQTGGKYSLNGGIDIIAGTVYGCLNVEKGELAGLLPILNISGKGVSGRLDGQIIANGNISKPSIWLTGSLVNGKIKGYPLDNVDVDIELANNIVTVNRFAAKQGSGILAVRGTANLDGPLNLELGGRGIDAGIITAWLDSTMATPGKLDFGAQISGTADNPHAAISLEIKDGGVANATFDALYGMFIVDKKSIHVNQLLMSKGQYRASAYGVIPLAALNREGQKRATLEDQMDLKIRLEEADLSILPLLTKQVSWAIGRTKGEIVVGGTLIQPLLQGKIAVENGIIKLASLADPIHKVGLDIQFEGDKINIKTCDGSLGAGSYQLSGTANLSGLAVTNYNAELLMNRLAINHKYFKGPLSGTLKLVSAAGKPHLQGKLLFENDTINIPYIPELSSTETDIGLDLELTGSKLRFYNPYMYDIWAEGQVKFAGTTLAPAVSGRINAVRGSVSYLKTVFRVKNGSAEFTQFSSFEPVIKLVAETKLERTNISLNVNGPISAMEMRLTSQPAMSQQEIFSLLTLRSRYSDNEKNGAAIRNTNFGRDEMMGLLDAGLQMRFLTEVEGTFRNALGLDEFRLVRGTLSSNGERTPDRLPADREVYNLEFGKYINDRLLVTYTTGVEHKEYTMGLRYDLTRNFSLTGTRDELNRQRFGLEMRVSFN